MKKIFSAHVKEYGCNYKTAFYNELMFKLHELRINLEKSHDVKITISDRNEETMSAVVTINERDYNKLILLNSHPFYTSCNTVVVDIDKAQRLSYKMEYETPIIWSEIVRDDSKENN